MLQPCRSNNLKNLIFEPSAAISVKIRDFHVFLAKPSLKNTCDPLVHWNLSLQRFGDQTNAKLCWEAKSAICIELCRKQARAAGIQNQHIENPVVGDFRSDFRLITRFSLFLTKIIIENSIWPNGPWNLSFQRFGDQTIANLCQRAKSAIYI